MFLFSILSRMDPPQEAIDETAESVNPFDQSALGPSDSMTNEYASPEALVKISQDMARALDEVRCPVDQKFTCAVSLLQGAAYDWWKLVLRNHYFQIQLHGTTSS